MTPIHPGSTMLFPHLVKHLHFPICIHALPKTLVAIHCQFTALCESGEHTVLQGRIVALDQVEHLIIENEEAAINTSFLDLRLFLKYSNHALPNRKFAIAG